MEDHRAEHGFADVAAVEAFGERDRLVDLGDDDPLVVLAAELANLDDLAGQAEPLAAAGDHAGRQPGADPQFQQFARPHAAGRRGEDQAGGADRGDQAPDLVVGHRQRPGAGLPAVRARNRCCVAAPGMLDTQHPDGVFEVRPDLLDVAQQQL
ncbi:hypothetical protein CTU88_43865 [Streptomyces sp. JV178]|uniref:hypothetical protein n=1 Tax=Streptomyces sp. JV178 TaxID=858632 RepID=UPI000C1B0917|nr:hypothetical protein [Streptomyces sp. JV178]PIM66257.1 hypothetical protein CTU88_43865 [Streptomyces sp. JV178]